MFGHFWCIFMENMWKRHFQIGGGIFLLLGAPVKSKFGGMKSRKHRFSRFSDFWSAWEHIFVDLNIPNSFQKSKIVPKCSKSMPTVKQSMYKNAYKNIRAFDENNIELTPTLSRLPISLQNLKQTAKSIRRLSLLSGSSLNSDKIMDSMDIC